MNRSTRSADRVKTLQQLTSEEHERKKIIALGTFCKQIQGDPFGIYFSWAGNVAHPEDQRMFDIIEPLCRELASAVINDNDEVRLIRKLLEAIPVTPLGNVPAIMGCAKTHCAIRDTPRESVLTFHLAGKSVRLMQCLNIDAADEESYNKTLRAKKSIDATVGQLADPPMSMEVTQYVMASLLTQRQTSSAGSDERGVPGGEDTPRRGSSANAQRPLYYALRSSAQEHYWLHMKPEERKDTRQAATETLVDGPSGDSRIRSNLDLVKINWQRTWNSKKWHPDFFRRYILDQESAKNAWEYVQEDIFVVTDKNRRVIFANIEKLSQLLFGDHATDVLQRCLDMWSFFTPLPAPESSRHVIDGHIRKLDPELDPSEATVDDLPNAKMAVAHYGCWAKTGGPTGLRPVRTQDTRFSRNPHQDYSNLLFPTFARAALGKASAMIRFMIKPLDPAHYSECAEIFANIADGIKVPVDPDDEDIFSLYALGVNGYTQRHRDGNDIKGGLAGLCTLGSYTGGHLCIPQLGLKVPYQPGTCAIIRGTALEHLVQDYSGQRFFIIGTNHESMKQNAWRRVGKLETMQPSRPGAHEPGAVESEEGKGEAEGEGEDEEEIMTTTCVHPGDDQDDHRQYSNEELHGPAVLREPYVRGL
ncbi:Uu.00g084410.m01.CDS01 [Anthostomella pinea]|uniref:Uu.00g084410.m01.CDS01 n=1 Tax=Anthostomella pinea TaxID=933095 RepID=A0AAI8VMW9_9PEZI|nr:Uu.00g084410.m01.CDS01 [Anthostomella pinea]